MTWSVASIASASRMIVPPDCTLGAPVQRPARQCGKGSLRLFSEFTRLLSLVVVAVVWW